MGPPHAKQQEIIEYIFETDPDRVKQADVACGRGFGKSVVGIDIAVRALWIDGNQAGLYLEPDWNRVHRVFLKKWAEHVPSCLYTLNKGERKITWINGSKLYYCSRNVTGSIQQMEDSQLGTDLTFVIDDEAALKCSYNFYVNTLATIRTPSPVRFYLTLTTPRVGQYKRLVTSDGHKLFRGTTKDNVYLNKNYEPNLRANMSAQQARRELDGEFVSLEGKIWPDVDLEKAWPLGNKDTVQTGFMDNEPWWLFCDLGSANGAFAVVQKRPATKNNMRIFEGDVWTIVADLCPHKDASASRAFGILNANFGAPCAVVAGGDVNTRSSGDGKTIAYFARQFWPNIPIRTVSELMYDKQVQYDVMTFLICSARKERRLLIAENFVSLDADSKRGAVEMFEEDAWPEGKEMGRNDYLPKDSSNRVQHIRDALLMGSVAIMKPPKWGFSEDRTG